MSGVMFKKWLAEAGTGIVTDEQLKTIQHRFLVAAANEAGGDRVRVPSQTSARTKAMRAAQKLIAIGASLDDCREAFGDAFCRATYFRWKAKIEASEKIFSSFRQDFRTPAGHEVGYVYALEFEGADGERFTKVGRSIWPKERARQIAASTDLVLAAAACVAFADRVGDTFWTEASVEKKAHEILADRWLELEWFALDGGVDEAVDAIIQASAEGFSRSFVFRA
jgi:hypothetical protein